MAITIPELPQADYNKELRLWITSNCSYLAHCIGEFIDAGELSRIKNPVILLQDVETNRTKKTTLEDFITHLEARIMTKTIPESKMPSPPPTRLIYPNGTVVTNEDVVAVPWYLEANKKIRNMLEARQDKPESKIPEIKISNLAQEVIGEAMIIAPQWFKGATPIRDIIEEIKLRVKEELDEEGKESTQEALQEALQLLYQISLTDRLPDTLQQELESFLWRHYDRE